eukprot:TRINITY_DN17733_c0_g1_i3.p1 TRINITY_DN17733_c0_g1~~TRINITY_DN17733_c0_g1_i3.p1  ORF type:complete len:179 (+),score=38.35 TRINITY_DN17733_c0_g1_i3:3-539(+)
MLRSLVGSEMCIRDRCNAWGQLVHKSLSASELCNTRAAPDPIQVAPDGAEQNEAVNKLIADATAMERYAHGLDVLDSSCVELGASRQGSGWCHEVIESNEELFLEYLLAVPRTDCYTASEVSRWLCDRLDCPQQTVLTAGAVVDAGSCLYAVALVVILASLLCRKRWALMSCETLLIR